MGKIVLLQIIYCIGFIVGSFSSDVKEIGSSISFAVASGSVIENSKSFSHVRAKRALALLVPFDDEDESSEEHHKSKRCWRARPVQKTRLSIEPGDETKEYTKESESRSGHGTKYNFKKLYDKKRSVEKSENESYESRESHADDSGIKLPYFKILPIKNPRKVFKQFLGTDQEMKNDAGNCESDENSEELILKKIKNHINSNDYNVLALVGKRANNHPKANRPKKYICYCREADCSGGNCQRMMYRPCSTCKNSGPGFISMANNKHRSHDVRNDIKNQESQMNDARVPLKMQYPVTKNEFIEYPVNNNVELRKNPGTSLPMNAANRFDHKNYQQNLPAIQDRRYQFSHETPRGVLTNQNHYVKPLDHYGFSHIPKSAMESEISSPKILENSYSPVLGKPASNEYRSENVKIAPDRSAYNQWSVNSYYPSIGNAGNSDMNNKNHEINRKKFFKLYQSNNKFSRPEIQFPNQPAAVPAKFEAGKNFGIMEPEMTTNLHPISDNVLYNKYHQANDFGWNIPNGKEAQSHPQLQHIETQQKALDYQKKSKSSSIQGDSQFEFKNNGYDVITENNFDSSLSLETDNYAHSSKSEENYSRDSDYEDITEEKFIDDQVSIDHNLAHTEDHRNVYYAEVSDAPEKYKLPLIPVEKINPSTDPAIIGNKNPNYDRDIGYSIDETTFRTQLEQPENEQSNWDNYNDNTTLEVIIQPDSNEKASSTYNDQFTTPESLEDSQLAETEPRIFDLEKFDQVLTSGKKESEKTTGYDYSDIQVITNGYFTSKAYDDFEKTNNDRDILGMEIGRSHDLNSNEEESYDPSSKNQMESGLENENISLTVDETTTADYIGDKNYGSSSNQQLAHEEFDEPSIGGKNRLMEVDMNKIITVTQASSLEDDEIIDATTTLISNLDENKHLQTSTEGEYSLVGSAESNELNLDSNSMKSNEEIESSKESKIFSTEAVGKKETDSAEYESGTFEAGDYYEPDSSTEEDTPIPNKEDVREADKDDNSYSENDFTEYSSEDSSAVLSEKKSESPADELVGLKSNNDAKNHELGNYKIDDEPVDVEIGNSPTKYFSPNDRVLEYIKKHSQNLIGYFNPDNDEQLRIQATPIYSTTAGRESQYVTPEIYHTRLDQDESAEQDFQGFNSGSESEEIINQPSILDYSNSNYKTTEHQAVKYSTEAISDDFYTNGDNYSATKRIEESIGTQIPKDLSDYDYDSPESIHGSILVGNSQELELVLDDEKSGITHLQKDISTHNYYDYADSTESSRSTEESVESVRDYSKEILSSTGYTQYNERENKESNRSATKRIEESIATQIPKDLSDYDYDSPESIQGSILVGNSQELKLGLDDEKSGITHLQKGISTHNYYDYGDSTESSRSTEESVESIRDYSKEILSSTDYTQYNERKNKESDRSATKRIEELIATQIPKDLSDYDYDSPELTQGSIFVGNSQELKLGLEDEKSGITHLQKGISTQNYYDNADSTESSRSTEESVESIRDYSKEILSSTDYTQYNERKNKESDRSATKRIEESIATQITKDLSDYDYDSPELIQGSILVENSQELKLGLKDEKSGITHLQKDISTHNYYDNADSTESSRSTEESVESIRDYSKEILSSTDYTQYNKRKNKESDRSATKRIEESIATQIPKDLSDYDYVSPELTQGSILIGNSQEMKLGLDDEKSGITHLQKDISTHNYYNNADSTESSRSTEESVESIRDYSKEILSSTGYTQYNERGNKESDRETTSSYSNRVADEKSTTKNYYDNEKVLDNYRSSDENVNTLGAQDYGRINAEGNSSPEMNSRMNTELNQYVGSKKYATQSTTKNLRPEVGVDQNKFILQHADETEHENYSNLSDSDSDGHDADIVRFYNPIELQESLTETTTKNLEKDSKYYSTQATQYTDNIYSKNSEGHYKSPLQIKSKDDLTQSYESEKDSGVMNNVELVSSLQSTGCCTKPPEIEDDAGYLGRLKPKNSNSNVKSLRDLVESDLYYIGDGVKLPLTIKKLKDGSFALSISDKICKHRSKSTCPCCVPREGRVLQEKRSEESDEKSTEKNDIISLRRRAIGAIPDDEESEIDRVKLDERKTLDDKRYEIMSEADSKVAKKNRDHMRRATRSISMPVNDFAKKYNLILNLNDESATAESSLRNNVIQRDQVTDDTQQDDSDLIPKMVLINDVAENKKTGLLLSTLQELIETEPKEALTGIKNKLRGIKSAEYDREGDKSSGQKAQYGYQRDNPILDRIRIIKQLQNKANGCEHRYQKDCHDGITQKTELLTMILNWLKELVTSERT